jgi:hypothetical protein
MFLIKGDNPEKYRDNHHHTGEVGVNIVGLLNAGRDRLAEHRGTRVIDVSVEKEINAKS